MTVVICMKCSRVLGEDETRCSCARSRVRAFPTRAVPSHFAQVAMTAAALEPTTEDEMRTALAMSARALRETN